MANTRGFQFTRGSDAPRNLKIKSTFPVAIVLLVATSPKLHYFDSPQKALEYFKEEITVSGGNWEKYLDLWENRFKCTVPIVISTVEIAEYEAIQKANLIDGINLLKKSKLKFDLLTVPDFPKDVSILNSMKAVCNAVKARTYYDIDVETLMEAKAFRNQVSGARVTLFKTPLGTFNTDTATNEWYDGGTVATFFRALLDGSHSYGWFKSLSNRTLPMDDVKNETDYHEGLDETDPLNEIQVAPVIEYHGLKFWFSDTTCSDDLWERDGLITRLIDNMSETLRRDLAASIDKDIDDLSVIVDSTNMFKNALIGVGLLLGGEIEFDREATTDAMIADGEFSFILDFQESPKIRKVNFHFNKVNRYSSVVVKRFKG